MGVYEPLQVLSIPSIAFLATPPMRHLTIVLLLVLLSGAPACETTGPDLEPAALTELVGDGVATVVGLEVQLSVRVVNSAGDPLEGVAVDWAVVAGGGSVAPAAPATDSAGVARCAWTLGTAAGEQRATAVVSGVPPATFSADAAPGRVVAMTIEPASVELESLEETAALGVVGMLDEHGNAVEDGVVTWSSSAPEVATVDEAGVVTALGDGTALIVGTLDDATDTATVTVAQRPVALRILAQPADRLQGEALAPVEVAVEDARGHPVVHAIGPVTLALTPAGPVDGTLSVEPAGGVARFEDVRVVDAGRGYRFEAGWGELSPVLTDFFDVHLALAEVTAGAVHTCGRTAGGRVYCWGENAIGRVGDGTTVNRKHPVPVDTEERFVALRAGSPATWALTESGAVYGWGQHAASPTAFAAPAPFVDLSARWSACGRTADGVAYCWPSPEAGQPAPVPAAALGGEPVLRVVSGSAFTCGIHQADSTAWCEGNNPSGELGNGTTVYADTPTPVLGAMRFIALDAGDSFVCGITADGPTYCWGANEAGQLGNGAVGGFSADPVQVAGGHAFTQLDLGGTHACALDADGAAFCWGDGAYGRLGRADQATEPAPVAVETELAFRSVSAGGFHTCGIATDGSTYCWGLNADGQLGDGGDPTPGAILRVTLP